MSFEVGPGPFWRRATMKGLEAYKEPPDIHLPSCQGWSSTRLPPSGGVVREMTMGYRVLLCFLGWAVFTSAARAQSGPDNDPDVAPGYVNSVFHHGQVDSINLYNGQLTIPISLGPTYPVGPKLKFQAVVTYSSRKNDYGHPTIQPPDYVYYPFAGNPALGHGWEFTLGAIKPCKQGNTGGYCYFGADGSQHMFNQGSKTGDGSQLYLSGSGPFDMWDGEGNHYVFGWEVSGFDDKAGVSPAEATLC